jgi:hypothetical protein
MLFGDLVLLATSEDDLQRYICNLNTITTKCSMEISMERTKIPAFQGKESIPSKICINNRILERVNKFTCLGYTLSYQGEVEYATKFQNTQKQWE